MRDAQRIAVFGCGGIGGLIAARLSRAGASVLPVTGNPGIASALAADGYRVRELDGSEWEQPVTLPPRVALSEADGQGPFDLVVMATPPSRTEAALASVRERLAPGARVVLCQNGLPEDRAARVLGRDPLVGAVVGFGGSMVGPGVYLQTSGGAIHLGLPWAEPPGQGSSADASSRRFEPVAHALSPVCAVRVEENFAGVRWSKLAINCCTTTLGAIGGDLLGPLLSRRFVRRLALEVFAEVAEVARAEGVRMTRVGGTFDIADLAITDTERRASLGSASLVYKHSLLFAVGMKYRRMRSSMLYALERGRPPEIDFLNGEIVRRGADHGVPTPVNARLADAVSRIFGGAARPSVETLRAASVAPA